MDGHQYFPDVPASWYYLGPASELSKGPVGINIFGREFVGYRTSDGKAAVLSARCSHLGVRLRNGYVDGDRLVCPLHGWQYGTDGICRKIPSVDTIPTFARQVAYPVAERAGHFFFFNRPAAQFELPFFDGVSPDQLLAAKPFELSADVPWFFVGANGFDTQHFRMAHDRTLIGEPEVSSPSPFARRVVAVFEVSGKSAHDRLTRFIAGPRVTMDITVWCGTLILVRALFSRTTTFGMFNVLPIDQERTRGRVIVWVKRSKTPIGRLIFDGLNAAIRRLFIQTFLRSDLPRLAGLRYQPEKLIAADRMMADYFAWLKNIAAPSLKENS
jgi:phenylpropionate dioxygenase-like ring-hydroxylating dioxygenase large terminal subunit